MANHGKKSSAQLRFGRYNVLTKLGQGAMATVYLAEDPALNRMVAIKVIHSHLASNSNLLDRFTVEAKTAAVLRNPNIVEIFDYGVEDDTQYLVMEYIDGPNLQFVLNLLGGEPMAPEVAAAVVCQAADGLSVAEKNGVVHRDIKPENMMFKSEGVLKIADFGIAHIAEQSHTQTGSILGSPNFMSPEQIDGRKPTHQTDLFSLGAVLYYCLTGQRPFTGNNIPTIMRNICDLPHHPVTDILPDADPFLVGLVDHLLQKDPTARPQGARWLSLQLRSYLNRKGILDLAEVTKGLLDKAAQAGGSQTLIDTAPAPGPDESSLGKQPLKPGMRVETPRPGTGIRPGTGAGERPGTWQAGKGTAHGLKNAARGTDVDFHPGTRASGGGLSKALWIGGGLAAAAILAAAVMIVALRPGEKAAGGKDAPAGGTTVPAKVQVASVTIEPTSMEIQEGESRRFLVEVKPAEATQGIRWESSEPFVAAVKDGELIAIKAGTTTIRAVSLDDPAKVGSAEVTVAAAPTPPPNVKRKESSRGGAGTSTGTGGQTGAGRTGGTGTQTTPPPPPPPPPPPRGEEPAKPPTTGKAILTITSAPPFAEVILDGRFLGTTPVKEKELTPGKHKILITHRSFPPLDTTITLGPGEKIIRFRLFR